MDKQDLVVALLFDRIPPDGAVYCNHCGWKGEKPKDNKCPGCEAWGRLAVDAMSADHTAPRTTEPTEAHPEEGGDDEVS